MLMVIYHFQVINFSYSIFFWISIYLKYQVFILIIIKSGSFNVILIRLFELVNNSHKINVAKLFGILKIIQ